ncbi:uncharacterized protein LOC127838679 isoform X1 [Dreissena polymorpha]|uniref:uncharacterized protein LOC127838679 isoform X1 n=2 Tax=Dreissena polymorpha TaxID=45954 RepID=UPI00226410AC|nr:uncharacterized protein LOC127838679 isoform X1 [Dreissena polymorpha]XP_052222510.1 uncharacterized protein LOC127838679 isoform X1 [Dreissena polymorpha]
MKGRRSFSVVEAWCSHIASRCGGDMEEAKVSEESMRLNRFLALAGFQEGGSLDNAVQWKDHLEIAASFFQKMHAPGTVWSNLGSTTKFILWAKDERLMVSSIVEEAVRKLKGCNTSTKRAAIRRAVVRRVQETADITTEIDLDGQLRSSLYFLDAMEGFARKPLMFFPQVRGLLIMIMAIPNGSRARDFVELRKQRRHLARPCPVCAVRGMMRVYSRVGDHIKQVHRMSGEATRRVLSEQRAATGRGKSGRPYYRCGICQRAVANNRGHFTATHGLTPGSEEFLRHKRELVKMKAWKHAATATKAALRYSSGMTSGSNASSPLSVELAPLPPVAPLATPATPIVDPASLPPLLPLASPETPASPTPPTPLFSHLIPSLRPSDEVYQSIRRRLPWGQIGTATPALAQEAFEEQAQQ